MSKYDSYFKKRKSLSGLEFQFCYVYSYLCKIVVIDEFLSINYYVVFRGFYSLEWVQLIGLWIDYVI